MSPSGSFPSGTFVDPDGWDDPPNSGRMFVISQLSVAPQNRGFDLDEQCRGPGDCIDNALYQLGGLANQQLQAGVSSGYTLILMELAGLDQPFQGDDESLTVKLYTARDGDAEPRAANNFEPAEGETTCCEFKIAAESLAQGQAKARTVARIRRGFLRTVEPIGLKISVTIGEPEYPELELSHATISGRLVGNLANFQEGIIGAAVPVSNLAGISNPYCQTTDSLCGGMVPNSSLLDLFTSLRIMPDIDLDVPRDGLERFELGGNGRVSACFDGCLSPGCLGPQVEPISPSDPASCAYNAKMEDGYSIAFRFAAVKATVVGIGD